MLHRRVLSLIVGLVVEPRIATVTGRLLYVLLYPLLFVAVMLALVVCGLMVEPVVRLIRWVRTGKIDD